jgi:mRNA (guanine-N7-)-methyltransferase
VSQLLEVGGNLIATTIDARVVLEHMMNTGYNFHFNHEDCAKDEEYLTISVGNDACQLKFHRRIVEKIFHNGTGDQNPLNPDLFGLEYTFTLIEGQDHALGVGQAVDLPEWLTPLPVLIALGEEAGLVLDYASNFHDFYEQRKDPITNHVSHGALYNMNVLNRSGTISEQEWDISRMYMAVKFRKERESIIIIEDGEDDDDHSDTLSLDNEQSIHGTMGKSDPSADKQQGEIDMKSPKVARIYVTAMSKAKEKYREEWQTFTTQQRTMRVNEIFSAMINEKGDK